VAELNEAEEVLSRVRGMGAIRRTWLKLPKPEEQAAEVERFRLQTDEAREELARSVRRVASHRRIETEVGELQRRLAPHRSVPDLANQEQVVKAWKVRLDKATAACVDAIERARESERAVVDVEAKVDAYRSKYGITPEEGVRRAEAYFRERSALEQRVADTAARQREATLSLVEKLRSLLEALAHWGLAEPTAGTIVILFEIRTLRPCGYY